MLTNFFHSSPIHAQIPSADLGGRVKVNDFSLLVE